MWTKVLLFLWIIGTVIYKSTPSLTNCSKRVQRCPVKKDQWAEKNDLLNCTSLGYVCLKDANGYLYESCMANFTIRANLGNCPTLFACQDNKPYLGTDETYYHCPEDVAGCPPRNHAEYSIHQLYKYPKCIETNISDEMENTSTTSTTKESSVIIPLVITLVIVALLGCEIGYFVYSWKKKNDFVYSRKKKYDNSNVTGEDIEGPSEEFLLSRMEENDDPQLAYVENRSQPEDYSEVTVTEGPSEDYSEVTVTEGPSEDYSEVTVTEGPSEDYSEVTVTEGPSEEDYQGLRRWLQSVNESEADRIQVLPLIEDDTIQVDKIYVPMSIVDRNEIHTSGTTNIQTISEIEPDKMFNIAPGKPARFVFMLGDAGYGKTVQCRRIAKSWCNAWRGKSPKGVNDCRYTKLEKTKNGHIEEWEKTLKNFGFVFYVPMRDVKNTNVNVDDMIYDYYRRYHISSEHMADIRAVLKHKRYKCLIILDGLDEWNISVSKKKFLLNKGIPNCKGMPNCTFLITMRSWRIIEVDPICRQGLFDKVVQLHGLDENGIEELTTNMLCNYFNIEEKSDEFLQEQQNVRKEAESLLELKSLMKIPLLAVFCILTWHENIKTGHTVTTLYLSIIEALMKRQQNGQQRGDNSASSVSGTLKDYSYVTNHMPGICILCDIVFKDCDLQNTYFVLSDDQLRDPVIRETIDLFLNIGLLNKNNAPGEIHKKNVRFNFLHKTIQEFIYSLFLFHGRSEAKTIEFISDKVSDIEKALQFSAVLTFLSGLSPAIGCKISSYLTNLSSGDKDIQNFRDFFSTASYYKVFHLFNLQLSCYREVRGSESIAQFQKSSLKFSFSDIILLGNDTDRLTIRESADILQFHNKDIKSLCMKFIQNDSKEGITNEELRDFLRENGSLIALDIDGYDRGKCRVLDDLRQRMPSLRTLGLFNVAFTDDILKEFLTKEDSVQNISALGLFYIKSADDLDLDFQYHFSSVHRLCSTRSGYVQKRKRCSSSEATNPQMKRKGNEKPLLIDILAVLPEYKNLSTLHVSYMDSDEDRKMLLKVLPKMKNLKHLGYDGSSIYAKPDYVYDTAVIKTVLEIIGLEIIFLNEITLNENILNLESLSELRRITLEVFQMKKSHWSTFVLSVSKIITLSKVVLNDTNIDDASYEQLKSFYFDVVKDESTKW